MLRFNKLLLVAVFALALAAGAYFGWLLYRAQQSPEPLDIGGAYFPASSPLKPFTLVDHDGEPFGPERFKGQWDVIYFGYTFCPDACPMTLSYLAKAKQLIDAQGGDDQVNYWLVSVDPQRDTPERLKEYIRHFDPTFKAATGEREQLDEVSGEMYVIYRINEPEPGESYYLVDHSSSLVVISPNAEVQALLTAPQTPESIAADLAKIRARYEADRG